jgi:hypothetical protein
MTNPAKDKGTRHETALVRYLTKWRIPAERRALRAGDDQGDLWAFAGRIVIEVKARRTVPSEEVIAGFWREANVEASRVPQCDIAVLVLNRPGKGDPDRWWAFLTLADLTWLSGLNPDDLPGGCGNTLCRITVGDFAALAAFHPDLTQLLIGATP